MPAYLRAEWKRCRREAQLVAWGDAQPDPEPDTVVVRDWGCADDEKALGSREQVFDSGEQQPAMRALNGGAVPQDNEAARLDRAWAHIVEGHLRAIRELSPGDLQMERLRRLLRLARRAARQPPLALARTRQPRQPAPRPRLPAP